MKPKIVAVVDVLVWPNFRDGIRWKLTRIRLSLESGQLRRCAAWVVVCKVGWYHATCKVTNWADFIHFLKGLGLRLGMTVWEFWTSLVVQLYHSSRLQLIIVMILVVTGDNRSRCLACLRRACNCILLFLMVMVQVTIENKWLELSWDADSSRCCGIALIFLFLRATLLSWCLTILCNHTHTGSRSW